MGDYYALNDDNSVSPISSMEWAKRFEDRERRRVGLDELNGARVSTVFLGLNHQFLDDGPPLIFETMVFPEGWDERLCWRYSTWEQAEAGHKEAVRLVQKYLDEGKDFSELWNEEQP
jgi:hypothetical protein